MILKLLLNTLNGLNQFIKTHTTQIKKKILIIFDDIFADMLSNKITQSYFAYITIYTLFYYENSK